MHSYQLPEAILFNYEELKQELTEKVSMYETLVYTDDQIKEAKADKAALNKLKKALNDERIRREKEYMQPFNDFKERINEIIGIIDKPMGIIDKQVKAYEDTQKQEKLEQVKAVWSDMKVPDGLTFEKVFDERMLNVTYTMSHVKQKMTDDIDRYNRDIATLSDLPEFGFEAVEVYKSTLDVNKAISEARRMSEIQKAKSAEQARIAEEEKQKKEYVQPVIEEIQIPVQQSENEPGKEIEATESQVSDNSINAEEPAKQWISFKALLTVEQAYLLREFFNTYNIQYKAI